MFIPNAPRLLNPQDHNRPLSSTASVGGLPVRELIAKSFQSDLAPAAPAACTNEFSDVLLPLPLFE